MMRIEEKIFDTMMKGDFRRGIDSKVIQQFSIAEQPPEESTLFLSKDRMQDCIEGMENTAVDSSIQPIWSNSRWFGWLLILIRRFYRKVVLKQYLSGMVEKNNHFHLNSIEFSKNAAAALDEQIHLSDSRYRLLKAAVDSQRAELDALRTQISELSARLEEIQTTQGSEKMDQHDAEKRSMEDKEANR